MARKIGEVFFGIRPDTSKMAAETRTGVQRAAGQSGKEYGKHFSANLGGMAKGIAASLAVVAGAKFFSGMISEAREAARVGRLTEAAIRSTGGAANVTSKHVSQLASSIALATGVQDELVQGSENLLLRFTKIKNTKTDKIFDQATRAVVDMTAGLNGGIVTQEGLKASSIRVGKALQDPLKGLTALAKAGVQFDDGQQKQIKSMVASGDIMGAQKIILAELEKKFKGAAAAAADPGQRAAQGWKEFQETLGLLVLPVINQLATAFVAITPVIRQFSGLIVGIAATMAVLAIAVKTYTFFANVAAIATKVWGVATQFLGKAMFGTPIGLIILAIAAFVAVIILAWKHSETFRNIVMNTWRGIQIVVGAVVTWFQTVAWPVLSAIFRGIGAVVAWLWNNIFRPYFGFIAGIVLWLWHNVVGPAVGGLILEFRILGGIVLWLWNNAIGPAFRAIAAVTLWLWHNVFAPAFAAIMIILRVFWWTISKVVWPLVSLTFRAIGTALGVLWAAFSTIFGFIWGKVLGVVTAIVNVLRGPLSAAFNALRGWLSALWGSFFFIFNLIGKKVGDVLGGVRKAFADAKTAIGKTWEGIKSAVKGPINFVISPVYAKIREFWNAIAGKIPGMGQLPIVKQFAGGGIFPGYTPGRDVGMIGVSGGEAIMRPEWTRFVGHDYVHAMNRLASRGGISALRSSLATGGGYLGGFDGGGIVPGILNSVGGFFGKAKDFVLGNLLKAAGPVINALRSLIGKIPGEKGVGEMARGLPTKLLDAAIAFIRRQDVGVEGGGGANIGGWQNMWQWIHSRYAFTTLNSFYRPGDPGYHGSGRAIDIGTPDVRRGGPLAFRVFNAIKSSFFGNIAELIYDFAGGNAVWNGKNHFFTGAGAGPGTHNDHIHWAMRAFNLAFTPGRSAVNALTGGHAGLIMQALGLVGRPNSWVSWMDTLIKRESSWNPNAVSSAGAIGLAQLLPGTWNQYRLRSLSSNIRDPLANIVASLRYIIARYGTIFNVQQANTSLPPRWYKAGGIAGLFDRGGVLPSGGVAVNMSGKPELVSRMDKLDELIALIEELIKAVERIAPGLGRVMLGSGYSLLTSARTR